MRLASTTMWTTVEESKQLLPLFALGEAVMVCTDASVRRCEIVCFEEMCLGFERARDKYGVLRDDGEFVKNEGVGGPDGCDGQLRWGIFEGIEGLLFFGARGGRRLCFWFVG